MHATARSAPLSLAFAGACALLMACSSAKGPSQLEIKLVDAPNPAVDQIVVNVTKVTAHSTSAGWVTVGPVVSPTTVNLLDLQTSVLPLGLVNLPPGKITQVRLFITTADNYVVPIGTTAHEPLVVPSGIESGIKIQGPWDVAACTRLSLTLDFDGKSSIEYHEANGTWILRPVIRPKEHATVGISCDPEAPPPPPAPECTTAIACPEGQSCASGECAPAAPLATGSTCATGTECLTGTCTDGACAPGGAGASCGGGSDCLSQSCTGGTCSGGAAVGAGQACVTNVDCLSGNCGGGYCVPGLQGTSCVVGGDCMSRVCSGGSCAPLP